MASVAVGCGVVGAAMGGVTPAGAIEGPAVGCNIGPGVVAEDRAGGCVFPGVGVGVAPEVGICAGLNVRDEVGWPIATYPTSKRGGSRGEKRELSTRLVEETVSWESSPLSRRCSCYKNVHRYDNPPKK